ncbi:Zinc knuckle CX2CX4HX4C [Trema orientale]|uniref:Zinc knuckle CX2CX4HX4C n=1 Tax=Trema orientale TaxID=63057 RepID=A0A2P5F940_TREOI|nr:Zinc knuckle CX2CX4HX4C [Trema orientale]
MDAIVDKWKAFSIMDEEEVLDVEDGSLAKSNSRLLFELVGRVITKKPIHKGVFQKVIKELWKQSSDHLKTVGGLFGVDWGGFQHVSLWVQIHGLSYLGMSEEVGQMLGNRIGKTEWVEKDESGRCLGTFLRVHVTLDIDRPLLQGLKIRLGSHAPATWVDFQYEKLLEFCFSCGCIGHGVS